MVPLIRWKRSLITAGILAVGLALVVFAAGLDEPLVIVESIPFGESRSGVIAADPAVGRVYVAQEDVPAIAVFDGATLDLLARVPTEGYHSGIAVDSLRHRVYVSQAFSGTVRVIDGSTHNTSDLPVPGLVHTIGHQAVDAKAGRLYVVRSDNFDVAVIDTATESFLGAVCPGCCEPHCSDLKVNPETGRLYAINPKAGRVNVVDTARRRTMAPVPVGDEPSVAAIDPGTGRVYVSRGATNQVAVIDGIAGSPTENTVLADIPLRENPYGLSINPTSHRLYAANTSAGAVSVIDGDANALLATIQVCHGPSLMAMLPDLGRLYVACDRRLVVLEERAGALGPR